MKKLIVLLLLLGLSAYAGPNAGTSGGGGEYIFRLELNNSAWVSGNCLRVETGAWSVCTLATTKTLASRDIIITRFRWLSKENVAAGKGCDLQLLVDESPVGPVMIVGDDAGVDLIGHTIDVTMSIAVSSGAAIQIRGVDAAADTCDDAVNSVYYIYVKDG